jgi:hypothetical protein
MTVASINFVATQSIPIIVEPLMVDSLLLAAVQVSTFADSNCLTRASGFFFERNQRLFLVTSRHVMVDAPTKHHPTHLQLELHTDANNLTASTGFDMPLYRSGKSIWRQGTDSAGEIDVAVIEIDRTQLPPTIFYFAFTPEHLHRELNDVAIGTSLLVVGFPLGFHDALHHMPVVRHAISASAFGLRFQGKGFFLTDARMHRGSSGSPVVMRESHSTDTSLPWILLGIHSAKFDMETRDLDLDEALGLNAAWYADILMTLTKD